MKKIIIATGMVSLFLTAIIIHNLNAQNTDKEMLILGFQISAEKMNRNLPRMIDEDTRLDKATVGPGARVIYHHTLINYSSESFDDLNRLQNHFNMGLKNKVCSNVDMKSSLQYGGTYVYLYSGNDGVRIMNIEISARDCGFPLFTSE